MNYIQYMKPGSKFNPSQWDFNKVYKSKLTPEQIKYAVELYFWRTKDPEMKKPYLFDRVRHVLLPTKNLGDIELSEGMLGLGRNLTPGVVSGLEPTIVSQRISSLFPHPETANGLWFIRSFDDPRVNYKSGGKLNYLNLIGNGKLVL